MLGWLEKAEKKVIPPLGSLAHSTAHTMLGNFSNSHAALIAERLKDESPGQEEYEYN